MQYTRLAQSADYLDAREKLRLAEIDLMQHREQRRRRPAGHRPVVRDAHLLDLTPTGRGDWYSSLSYE